MINYFESVIKIINNNLKANEEFCVYFSAEELDYARFNHAKIRQCGTVWQRYLSIDLQKGLKHASFKLGLSLDKGQDQEKIIEALNKLREQISLSADDPFLMLNDSVSSSLSVEESKLEDKDWIVESILKESHGLDLVGSYLGGPIYQGFANSRGQINWFLKSSFILDYSIYLGGDKAIKQSYSDTNFKASVLKNKINEARASLTLLKKEAINLKPGSYRAYFSPSAVYEILTLLNWDGFSRKAIEVKSSPLIPLFTKQRALSPQLSLFENTQAGVGPNFQSQGFLKPDKVPLIFKGELENTLISPKTAKEYGLTQNGSDESESCSSLDMASGTLAAKDIHSTLGDGLYINHLWYLNFSDRQNGCLTGMTRFFCYMVKDGQPYAPFSVMRFDDSIYRILGNNLSHLTVEREMLINNDSYDERSTSCAIIPGLIAENVRFTL
jgi:predicted Zn-dependent protease